MKKNVAYVLRLYLWLVTAVEMQYFAAFARSVTYYIDKFVLAYFDGISIPRLDKNIL